MTKLKTVGVLIMDKKTIIVAGVITGALAYHFGLIDSLMTIINSFTNKESKAADSGVGSAPLSINRDVGSVSQVMTDVDQLNGMAHGQNARNFGVSGSHGLTPGLEAFIDRATVGSFGQNFDGRSVGLT